MDKINRRGEKRLHPASWLFIALDYIKTLIIPILVALLAGGGDTRDWLGFAVLVPLIATALLQYWVYRYSLDSNEMVVREGVFFKQVRHIPYQRIQNLNLRRGLLHRLFNVVQVELESASGGKPEAVMRVLTNAAIEEIRAKVLAAKSARAQVQTAEPQSAEAQLDRAGRAVAEDETESLLELGPAELVLAGIISNKGLLVVAAFLGLFAQGGGFDRFEPVIESRLGSIFAGYEWLLASLAGTAVALVVLVLVFLVLIRILSITFMLVVYYGFVLSRIGDKLAVRHGLLTQIESTLPRRRIQSITLAENLLHRLFKRCSIRVYSAGGSAGSESRSKLNWLAPIIRRDLAGPLLSRVQPQLDYRVEQWQRVEFRAWKRISRRYALLIVPLAVLLALIVSADFLWLLALLPWVVLHARKYVASIRYGFSGNALVFESGWLVRYRTIVPLAKIQSLTLKQSPFDTRARMTSLVADVAGINPYSHHIAIPYIDDLVARQLADNLYRRVSATAYV